MGTVGAGKSSLLSAILGELEQNVGKVRVRGSVAYTAQQVNLSTLFNIKQVALNKSSLKTEVTIVKHTNITTKLKRKVFAKVIKSPSKV